MALERSYIMKVGPQGSKWRLKVETTRRKNAIDNFASREYLRDETMTTHKHALGLQYLDMKEDTYRKFDVELGLPGADASSFLKVDAFMTKSKVLIADKLKLVWQLQGGAIRPIMGS